MNLDFLRKLPLFAGLSPDDLEQLCGMAETIEVTPGEVFIKEGSIGDAMYIVLEGEVEISKHLAQQEIVLAKQGRGKVIGEMSLLDQFPRTATARALSHSQLLRFHRENFQNLISSSPSAAMAILHTVTERLRHTEAMMHQHEKMAALGTMAAGLAHELNNPAAAAQRSSLLMRQALIDWQEANVLLTKLQFDEEKRHLIDALSKRISLENQETIIFDPLTRSDLEFQLQEWLEAINIDNAWEYAPILISLGWKTDDLEEIKIKFHGDELTAVISWLVSGTNLYSLLGEVNQSTKRISEIVKAVKSYSHLDQAPVKEVDIHESLENTLTILKHKIKPGTKVIREYGKDVPRIDAFAGELNQVWTNLIDNSLDAMGEQGELLLKTYLMGENIAVEICDNGSGIPTEIQERIFEPFFTTKPPGSGTGLGLHISYDIVVNRHQGRIQLNSNPGKTCFQVILPRHIIKE